MLQDSHEVCKVITPPLPAAAARHPNINAYNSLSKPEAKNGDGDSYTVTLVASPVAGRPSGPEEPTVDESSAQT